MKNVEVWIWDTKVTLLIKLSKMQCLANIKTSRDIFDVFIEKGNGLLC